MPAWLSARPGATPATVITTASANDNRFAAILPGAAALRGGLGVISGDRMGPAIVSQAPLSVVGPVDQVLAAVSLADAPTPADVMGPWGRRSGIGSKGSASSATSGVGGASAAGGGDDGSISGGDFKVTRQGDGHIIINPPSWGSSYLTIGIEEDGILGFRTDPLSAERFAGPHLLIRGDSGKQKSASWAASEKDSSVARLPDLTRAIGSEPVALTIGANTVYASVEDGQLHLRATHSVRIANQSGTQTWVVRAFDDMINLFLQQGDDGSFLLVPGRSCRPGTPIIAYSRGSGSPEWRASAVGETGETTIKVGGMQVSLNRSGQDPSVLEIRPDFIVTQPGTGTNSSVKIALNGSPAGQIAFHIVDGRLVPGRSPSDDEPSLEIIGRRAGDRTNWLLHEGRTSKPGVEASAVVQTYVVGDTEVELSVDPLGPLTLRVLPGVTMTQNADGSYQFHATAKSGVAHALVDEHGNITRAMHAGRAPQGVNAVEVKWNADNQWSVAFANANANKPADWLPAYMIFTPSGRTGNYGFTATQASNEHETMKLDLQLIPIPTLVDEPDGSKSLYLHGQRVTVVKSKKSGLKFDLSSNAWILNSSGLWWGWDPWNSKEKRILRISPPSDGRVMGFGHVDDKDEFEIASNIHGERRIGTFTSYPVHEEEGEVISIPLSTRWGFLNNMVAVHR